MATIQEEFWSSDFGDEYTQRNFFTPQQLDDSYREKYGVTRTDMNQKFLSSVGDIETVLEVGCNVGNQLAHLQLLKSYRLYGIDINVDAVERAKDHTRGANIVQGSAFDLPFRDAYFDLVFTSGVLIHISPDDLEKALREVYRVSKKYIWGFEYFAPEATAVEYRGNKDRLWKRDFAAMYQSLFPDLEVIQEQRYPYLHDQNIDSMFLLKKRV